jgi:hypothetical protein
MMEGAPAVSHWSRGWDDGTGRGIGNYELGIRNASERKRERDVRGKVKGESAQTTMFSF